jgi:hypothetical protein
MQSGTTTYTRARATVFLTLLITGGTARASTIWFDETNGGSGFPTFNALATHYLDFVGSDASVVTFNDLPANTLLAAQYEPALGVVFTNTVGAQYADLSRLQPEGGAMVEDLTGYDGSYMPDGDLAVLKFGNDDPSTPFTINFDHPVSKVGAFVGMGVQGSIHALTVRLYDSSNVLIDQGAVEAALWESSPTRQNYESFFAVVTSAPRISRVEILNEAHTDFANALVLDNLAFSQPAPQIPEPASMCLLAVGGAMLVSRREHRRPIN